MEEKKGQLNIGSTPSHAIVGFSSILFRLTLFFLQCAERFQRAERMTFKVGASALESSLTAVLMAAQVNTLTTSHSLSLCLLLLSAFQPKFLRNACA